MFCKNCGKQLADDALFCDGCGAITGNNQNQTVPPPPPAQQQFSQPQYQQYQQPLNNQDSMASDNTKLLSILSYIGILFVIGLIAEPQNQKVRFHVNQGCVLFITDIVLAFAAKLLNTVFWYIPAVGNILAGLASFAGWAGILALIIIGIMNAAKGEEKELPVIGKIRIIK